MLFGTISGLYLVIPLFGAVIFFIVLFIVSVVKYNIEYHKNMSRINAIIKEQAARREREKLEREKLLNQ